MGREPGLEEKKKHLTNVTIFQVSTTLSSVKNQKKVSLIAECSGVCSITGTLSVCLHHVEMKALYNIALDYN